MVSIVNDASSLPSSLSSSLLLSVVMNYIFRINLVFIHSWMRPWTIEGSVIVSARTNTIILLLLRLHQLMLAPFLERKTVRGRGRRRFDTRVHHSRKSGVAAGHFQQTHLVVWKMRRNTHDDSRDEVFGNHPPGSATVSYGMTGQDTVAPLP